MTFATWAYPWDLLDTGVESVAEQLLELGITEINLATNYHTVQTYLPHNPERRTFFARSSSYFQPGEMYGDLEPVPNERMGDDDWLAVIDRELADTEVSLNSWTVGCHNSRLGMSRPEYALRNAFGDPLVFGLCPSRSAVQEYLLALLADLDDRAAFERIELETFNYFYGTGYGWHHDKFHARLGALGEFLFGVCFCDDCRANARQTGVDADAVAETVRSTVDAISAGEFPHDVDVGGWLREHPEVGAYIDVRIDTLTDLYRRLAAVVEDAELSAYVGMKGVENSWMHGLDLRALSDSLDYVTVMAYRETREETVDCLQLTRELVDLPVHVGVLPAHPYVHDEATVGDIVDGLVENDTDRVSFYNYGLLPERNLDWIGSSI
ncbi:hypothetical protein [Natronorubrum halophilum]|uniref:hypothetical protein n=1 Tax=Natronorubrum halophilum TaxID=1702106 RepID=UPI0010C1D4E3|nr:hypothetical protein [Natronorubrum halophilum]